MLRIARHVHRVTVPSEQRLHHAAHRGIVVHQEDGALRRGRRDRGLGGLPPRGIGDEGRRRQVYQERGAPLGRPLDRDPPAMCLHDGVGDREPEPRPLARLLGREERREQVRQHGVRDP